MLRSNKCYGLNRVVANILMKQYKISSKQTNIFENFGEIKSADDETLDVRFGVKPFKRYLLALQF